MVVDRESDSRVSSSVDDSETVLGVRLQVESWMRSLFADGSLWSVGAAGWEERRGERDEYVSVVERKSDNRLEI